jgi:beta-glucosidase
VLVFAGLNSSLEGEGHDRSSIDLPEPQESMVKAMIASGESVVVVLTGGSAIAANSEAANATAVFSTVTFYKSLDQLPEFTDNSMQGRTYRYFKGEPLYPFGYGLSYSTFAYSGLKARRTADGAQIRATVKNTSSRDGDEVVQLYVSGGPGEEIRSLRGYQRIHLRGRELRGAVHASA